MQSRTVSGYAHMLRLGELTTLCYTLLYLASLHLVARAEDVGRGYGYVDTTALSSILDRLTNRTVYDKRLRPRYGDKPVDVGITIHVSSISAVSEVDMDFTLDFYMRQNWQDPRLAFEPLETGSGQKISSLTVGVDYMDKLWKPDTFFPNEKKSFFHTATTHNSFLRIDSDGTVATSQRLTVTATCPMKLQLFPMDSQRCKLEIESYGYSVVDINYLFPHGPQSISTDEPQLPQFVLSNVRINRVTEKLSSGEYSRLLCYFMFERNLGFYLLQIYIPSVLIVSISWVSFWLSREATPARVALGVTTVLTMTTLMTTTNSAMPKVSYVKSIDIFLGTSFMMVFCSLLEYAAIGYLSKRLKLCEVRKKSSVRSLLSSPVEPAMRSISVPAYFNTAYRPFYSSTDRKSTLFLDEQHRPKVSFMESDCDCPLLAPQSEETTPGRVEIIVTKHEFAKQPFDWKQLIKPSNIDKYSRIFFPMCGDYPYGYSTFDIQYFWGDRNTTEMNAVKFEPFTLPQFKQTAYTINKTIATTASGSYDRLAFEVLLVRNMGFYTMNIVIPSVLIVTISWVSFWLNREASPARVGLGVTTVLTMTTLITTTNNSMPKVSYIKGLDVFLNFCFVMVFASLVEYAIVSYMNKWIALRREKRRKQAEQQQRQEIPMFSPKQPNNNSYEMGIMSQNSTPAKSYDRGQEMALLTEHASTHQLVEMPLDCDCRTIPFTQNPRLVPSGAAGMWPAPFGKSKKKKRSCCQICSPAKIDKCSRYAFPLIFIGFNVIYWSIMHFLASLDGYSTLNINYEWCGVGTAADCRSVKLEASAELPSYTLSDHCVGRTVATTASGSYSRLAVIFIFSRESGFYMLQIFVPAGLVVGISWVSFWINRDSAPSRTIIGVMTVLTETHLMTGTNRRLPPVSYIKAVDIYLGFCYLLVVFALIEYACVAYTKKKNEDRRRRQKKSDFKPPSLQTPDLLQDARLAECTCNAQQSIVAIVKKPSKFCIRHSHIDIAARIIFPSAFFIFNVVFWIVLLLKANRMPYTEASTAQTCNEGS
ncbi:unnamed protein product, partial [Mesorhabditis spiculigera]